MDLYPDVEEVLKQATIRLHLKKGFPMAPSLTLLGFFTILTIEQIILVFKESSLSTDGHHHHHHHHQHQDYQVAAANFPIDREEEHEPLLGDSSTPANTRPRSSGSLDENHHHFRRSIDDRLTSSSSVNRASYLSQTSIEGISDRPARRYSIEQSSDHANQPEENGHVQTETLQSYAAWQEHSHYDDLRAHSSLRVIILLIAMSFHAIFEGMAVGLQTSIQSLGNLFAALSLHKMVIAAGVGLNVATSSFPIWLAYLACFIFAAASPIGVLGGFAVMLAEEKYGTGFYLVNGVLQGLACGTFFYVVFFEILPHEFNTGTDRLGKILALLAGFALVVVFLTFFHD